jgi:hypothetical protein
MSVRRLSIHLVLIFLVAILFYGVGSYSAERVSRRQMADRDARIDALRTDMTRALAQINRSPERVAATAGNLDDVSPQTAGRTALVDEIKRQLQDEMGLLPVQMLRDRRRSFVELYAYDNHGRSNYGTAGYLGQGYFITVKHGVEVLPKDPDAEGPDARRIVSVKVVIDGRMVTAHAVDAGDADIEVHPGDWAIIKVDEAVTLPPLHVNVAFAYDFADPIVRLGNDYSKGIILSTGYVGQRISTGLVTCLTDGHPGVSGGGVLDQRGQMVGIPIGRMQGDFRFSFILPVRREMFRKVPGVLQAQPPVVAHAPAAVRTHS